MTNATISLFSTLTNPSDHAVFVNAFSTAMQAAGFTEVASYTNNSFQRRALSIVANAGKTYGTLFVEIGFTGLSPDSYIAPIFTGFSGFTSPSTPLNPGFVQAPATAIASSFLGATFSFYTVVHAEIFGVLILRNGVLCMSALLYRPLTVPTWWDENAYPFAFGYTDISTYAAGTISSLRPSGTSNAMLLNTGNAIGVAPNSSDLNSRLVLTNTVISNNNGSGNNNGVCAFSTDVAAVASSGANMFDTFTSNSNAWALIEAPSTTNLRLAIRTGA